MGADCVKKFIVVLFLTIALLSCVSIVVNQASGKDSHINQEDDKDANDIDLGGQNAN